MIENDGKVVDSAGRRMFPDRAHWVDIRYPDMARLRKWMERPNGSFIATGWRVVFDAVEGGGIAVRTDPYRYIDPMAEKTTPNLTPTQDLLMEALAARTRLGHTWWTFDRNRTSSKGATELEKLGYIRILSGMTEGTFRAELTALGMEAYFEEGYVAPIMGGPN